MPKKPRKKSCIVGSCGTTVADGAKVCKKHLHPAALQAEIVRLRSTSLDAWEVMRHAALRELVETIAELDRRAKPGRGGSTEAVAHTRSHNRSNGVVTVGKNAATLADGVGSYSDRGRLGAVLSMVAATLSDVKQVADPGRPAPKEDFVRCTRKKCPEPYRRQAPDSRHCRFCGWSFKRDGRRPPPGSDESGQGAPRATESESDGESANGDTEGARAARLRRDREGLVAALRQSVPAK